PAFQGHAIGSSLWPALAVASDVLHLAAAGLWMGTLVVIVTVALPRSDGISADTMIRAFSPYALGGAATLAATGLFASWLHVRHPLLAWESTYGRVLLLKIALVAGVVAVGAVNWRRLTPQLTAPGGVARLARAARVELALAAAVFLVTAVLVATPLPGE
ncbi:MAG TPA: CopD family protein, partial [Gemmatimonadales bacterium]|nr:CopD family protein [Gemmatimonadales bacterium]